MSAEYQQIAVYDDLYKIPDNMIGQIIGGGNSLQCRDLLRGMSEQLQLWVCVSAVPLLWEKAVWADG